MSNSNGFAVPRKHGGDRFHNAPEIRRHSKQQVLLPQDQMPPPPPQQQHHYQKQQQLQVQRPLRPELTEKETETSMYDSALPSASTVSPRNPAIVNNIDSLIQSVTPIVPALNFSEGTKMISYFRLEDLWESFDEWSAYGAGVPLLINGSESVKQYYVPSLSGIQLYADPLTRLSRPAEESEAEASRIGRLSLRDKPPMSSSNGEAKICNSPGPLIFEYLEEEQPHHRRPLSDKISALASKFPELKKYRSCDLLPSSWIAVAWYPIYRIPMGQTLQSLDASFLTFHSLSTNFRGANCPQFHSEVGRKVYGGDGSSSKISLPVFGLASYKLRGSILMPGGDHEWERANSLLNAAGSWLQQLKVNLSDYRFFVKSHR